MLDLNIIIEYAPIVIIIITFLFKNRIFVTPEQLNEVLKANKALCGEECTKQFVTKEDMQIERKELLKEVENRFLSIIAFREFEKRIDGKFTDWNNRFDKVDASLEHITDLLIKKGN